MLGSFCLTLIFLIISIITPTTQRHIDLTATNVLPRKRKGPPPPPPTCRATFYTWYGVLRTVRYSEDEELWFSYNCVSEFRVNSPDMNRATIGNIEEASLASLGFSPRTQIAQVSSDLITHKPVFSLMFEVGGFNNENISRMKSGTLSITFRYFIEV